MRVIYLHGRNSTGQTEKARLIRRQLPDLVAPDFTGSLAQRLEKLEPILGQQRWVLIGSSFGGLMAALWTCLYPERVERLILLAPALHYADFEAPPAPVNTPCVLIHGWGDEVVPFEAVLVKARQAFSNLVVFAPSDDHQLLFVARTLDWSRLTQVGEIVDFPRSPNLVY